MNDRVYNRLTKEAKEGYRFDTRFYKLALLAMGKQKPMPGRDPKRHLKEEAAFKITQARIKYKKEYPWLNFL